VIGDERQAMFPVPLYKGCRAAGFFAENACKMDAVAVESVLERK